ncbi:MAG: GDSL-type esterase/lipase family protein [bacterium]
MSTNSAIIPVPNIMKDFYDWAERRQQKVDLAKADRYDLIFMGDSITHMFEMPERGLPVWQKYYGNRKVLDLGYGWDTTQNLLWRLQNGEFAGQQPKLVVLNIGTNNLTGNTACRQNTPAEVVEGIDTIYRYIHQQSPATTILVMAIFPRGMTNEQIFTDVIAANKLLVQHLQNKPNILHLNINEKLLEGKAEISLEIMDDRCHPTEKGYEIWAKEIEGVVGEFMG